MKPLNRAISRFLTIVRQTPWPDRRQVYLSIFRGGVVKTYHKASDGSSTQVFCDAVIEFVGEDGFRRLREAHGGIIAHVSLNPGKENWLSKLFGWEVAKQIGQALAVRDADGRLIGNVRVSIPLGSFSRDTRIRAVMDRLLIGGQLTAPQIAQKLRVNERTVWRRKAKLVSEGRMVRSVRP